MCSVLGVGRTSYYDWLKSETSPRQLETKKLAAIVKDIFMENRCNYGSRRIRKAMNNLGIIISRRRVAKLMKSQDLHCKTKRKFRITTDSKHNLPIAANLLNRDFKADFPDKKYVGDITYVWTQEGWLYLAVVIDLFSRKIVGWSMQDNMRTSLGQITYLPQICNRRFHIVFTIFLTLLQCIMIDQISCMLNRSAK